MCSQCSRGPVTTRKASPMVRAGHATNMLIQRMSRATLRRSCASSRSSSAAMRLEVQPEAADVGDVHDGVHEDPDEVHEVPVHAGRLREGVAVLVEMAL